MISIREVKITHTFQKVEHSRLGIKIAKVICCMYICSGDQVHSYSANSKVCVLNEKFSGKKLQNFLYFVEHKLGNCDECLIMVFVKANIIELFSFCIQFHEKNQ